MDLVSIKKKKITKFKGGKKKKSKLEPLGLTKIHLSHLILLLLN